MNSTTRDVIIHTYEVETRETNIGYYDLLEEDDTFRYSSSLDALDMNEKKDIDAGIEKY